MALIHEARDIAICMRSLIFTLSQAAARKADLVFGGADGGSLDAERYSIDLRSSITLHRVASHMYLRKHL